MIHQYEISRYLYLGLLPLRINLPLFSTVVPAIIFMFLSCRPFVAITTLSTGFVGVEETEVTSTPTKPVDNVVIATGQKNTTAGTTVENKGKLILNGNSPR